MSRNRFRKRVLGSVLPLVVAVTASGTVGAPAQDSTPAVQPAPAAAPPGAILPWPGFEARPAAPAAPVVQPVPQPAAPPLPAPVMPTAPATSAPATETVLQARTDAAPAEPAQGDASPSVRIRAALERKLDGDFIEAPLTDVIDYVANQVGVSLVLDHRAIEALGVDVGLPISLTVKDIPARSMLSLLLEPLGLAAVVHRDVLLVTSVQRAESIHETRVYDVGDLVAKRSPDAALGGTRAPGAPVAGSRVRLDELADTIARCVEPDSWDQAGGAGVIAPLELQGAQVLVVRQTQPVHDQVENLLAELRRLATRHGAIPSGTAPAEPPGAAPQGPAEPSLPGPTLQPRQSPPSAPISPAPAPPVPPGAPPTPPTPERSVPAPPTPVPAAPAPPVPAPAAPAPTVPAPPVPTPPVPAPQDSTPPVPAPTPPAPSADAPVLPVPAPVPPAPGAAVRVPPAPYASAAGSKPSASIMR